MINNVVIKAKYPIDLKNIKGFQTSYINATKSKFEGLQAIVYLKEMMDLCNEIDGGKEFLLREARTILSLNEKGIVSLLISKRGCPLQFKKTSTAKWFLKQHKELIETAEEFI